MDPIAFPELPARPRTIAFSLPLAGKPQGTGYIRAIRALGARREKDEVDVELRDQAIHNLRRRRGFRIHVAVYVIVNALLIAIWFFAGHGYFWPGWVLAGWGIGLALNAWYVYGSRGISEADISREMDRLGGRAAPSDSDEEDESLGRRRAS